MRFTHYDCIIELTVELLCSAVMIATGVGTVASQVNALVPPNRNIQIDDIKSIQQLGWAGNYISISLLQFFPEVNNSHRTAGHVCSSVSRAMYWRLALGIISNSQSSQWKRDLMEEVADYRCLQKEILPDITTVAADPLSHMLSPAHGDAEEGRHAPGWDKYFEVMHQIYVLLSMYRMRFLIVL